MRKSWVIAKRDLMSFLVSPVAYIVVGIFTALSGFFFFALLQALAFNQSQNFPYVVEIRNMITNMAIIFMFVAPMLTMKSFAEERKMGTFELLLTSPVSLTEIVLGKFLAVGILFALMVLVTWQFAAFLLSFGNPDVGPMMTGYLGLFLLGLAFLAVGVFASSLTDNPMIATLAGFAVLLLLWVVGWAGNQFIGTAHDVVAAISLMQHLDHFTQGVLELSDVIYYLSFTSLFLWWTVRRLEWGRW